MALILIIILSVAAGVLLAIFGLCAFAACAEQDRVQFERMSGRLLESEMTGRRIPAIR